MKRKHPLPRSRPRPVEKGKDAIRRRKPIRRKPRTPEQSERAYGPPEHQEWLRQRPCVGCGIEGSEDSPLVLHHTSTGGTSRKADASTQVPLCVRDHHLVHNPPLKGLAYLSREVLKDHAVRLWSAWRASIPD